MTEYKDFIDHTLKPEINNRLSFVFPEMEFNRCRNGWESSKALFNRESTSKLRRDKSVVTDKLPFVILEQGGDAVEIIEYYRQSRNLSTNGDAIKALCKLLGLTPPPMQESPQYAAYMDKQKKLIRLVATMQEELFSRSDARAALKYLKEERGYSDELIKGMGLGWCSPETGRTLKDILKEGVVPTTGNYIAIPYISSGAVKGVVFRNTTTAGNKYLDAFISKTDTKKYSLFGLTGLPLTGKGEHDKEIIVVEGELDALRAQHEGLRNVVGAAGKNLSQEALSEAKQMGVERVILLYDYDKGTDKTAEIKKALDTIRAVGLTGMVASFPQDGEKVDTDSFLATHSLEDLEQVVYGDPIFGCQWEVDRVVEPYSVDAGVDEPTAIDIDKVRREVAALLYGKFLKWERDYMLQFLPELTAGTLTESSVREELCNIEAAQREQMQREATSDMLQKAQEALSKGIPAQVLTSLQNRIKEVQEITRAADYENYIQLPTEESIKAELRMKKGGIPTGYYFMGNKGREVEWELPTGALTYVCAPTSHGKSRLLQNLALNLAKNSLQGSILYISLEEDTAAVVERLINIQANTPLNRGTNNNSKTIREYYGEDKDFVAAQAKPILDDAYRTIQNLLTSGRLRLISRREFRSIGYIEELSGFINHLCKQEQVQAVFIDYVQEIYSKNYNGRGGRKDELMDICNTLMDISVNVGLPIILAAQLNREATSPLDMSVQNIADASNIEHSANCVLLLWDSVVLPVAGKDNSYYFYTTSGQGENKTKKRKTTEEAQKLEDRGFNMGTSGSLYAVLAKNRLGERNMDAILKYNGNTGKVESNKPETEEQQAEKRKINLFENNCI